MAVAMATFAHAEQEAVGDAYKEERRRTLNKLFYRCKQRGLLELDLVIGLWAEQALPEMEVSQLQEVEEVLEQENPEVWKWLTGQEQAPLHMQENTAFQSLKAHIDSHMQANLQLAARARKKVQWVRGWDDLWRTPATSPLEEPAPPLAGDSSEAKDS